MRILGVLLAVGLCLGCGSNGGNAECGKAASCGASEVCILSLTDAGQPGPALCASSCVLDGGPTACPSGLRCVVRSEDGCCAGCSCTTANVCQ